MCTAAFLVQCCDISSPQNVYLEIKEMARLWRCCCQGWQPLFFTFDQHNGEREQVLEKLPTDLYKCACLLWQVDPTHKLSVVNFFFFRKCILLLWVLVVCLSLCLHHVNVSCLYRPEVGIGSPGTGVLWFWATIWVLGMKPMSSGRASTELSSRPSLSLLKKLSLKLYSVYKSEICFCDLWWYYFQNTFWFFIDFIFVKTSEIGVLFSLMPAFFF